MNTINQVRAPILVKQRLGSQGLVHPQHGPLHYSSRAALKLIVPSSVRHPSGDRIRPAEYIDYLPVPIDLVLELVQVMPNFWIGLETKEDITTIVQKRIKTLVFAKDELPKVNLK